jgi:antitoxin CptB
MIADVEMRRLRWRCRRGLLENDLVLQRFLDRHGERLEARQLAALNRLLAMPDTDLWDVIAGRSEVVERELQDVVSMLRAA